MMSVDNYKVYFSGFPKDTCSWSDLYHLFSRVVQIKHLWISSRKGHGYITLYSESSFKFMLQKDIQLYLNGCSIKLEEFTQKHKNGGTIRKQNLQIFQDPENFSRIEKVAHMSSTQPTFQHYKHCRSSFWKDVPHEKASLVIKKRKKKRLKTTRDYTLQIQTCKKIQKKKLKRRKKRKDKVSRVYHNADGLYRDYSLIHSKINEDKQCVSIQRKIFAANSKLGSKTVSNALVREATENCHTSGVNNPVSCHTSNFNNPENCHTSDVNNPVSCHTSNFNNPENCHTSDVNNPVSCHISDVNIPGSCHISDVNNQVSCHTSDDNNQVSCHISDVNNQVSCHTSDVNIPGSCHISDVNNQVSCHISDSNNLGICHTSDVNNQVSCHISDINNPESCHTSDVNSPVSCHISDVNNQVSCHTSDSNNLGICHTSDVNNPGSCITSDVNNQVSCHISDVNNQGSCITSDVNIPGSCITSDVNNQVSCITSDVNNPESCHTSDVNSPVSCHISDVNNQVSCHTSDSNNLGICHTSDVNNPGSCITSDVNNQVSCHISDVNNQGSCHTSDVNNLGICHTSDVNNQVSCHTSDSNNQGSCHTSDSNNLGICHTSDDNNQVSCHISDVNNPVSCHTSDVNNQVSCHISDVNNQVSCHTSDSNNLGICHTIDVNNPGSCHTSDSNNSKSCHTSDFNNTGSHHISDVNNPESCHTSNFNNQVSCHIGDVNNPKICHASDVNNPVSCHISDVNNPKICHASDVNNQVSCHISDVNNPVSCHTSDFNNPESCHTSDVNNPVSCHISDVNNPVSCHISDSNNLGICHTSDFNNSENCPFPLYIKISMKIHLIYLPYHVNDSYKHICDFVHKVEGIPVELQLLIYQGKVLTGKWDRKIMEPYTTVEVIVKGKGGMMEASAYPLIITKDSTEKDVFCWLQHVVKISDNVLSQYPAIKHLDGETLLDYNKNFLELKQETKIPIGIARKILLSLDSGFLKKWEASEMFSWSFEEFMKFIKESIGENEECGLVEASVRENFIDTMTFYSYEDSQALIKDLDITDPMGVICVICRKLIKKRNTMLEKSESHTKLNVKADKTAVEFDLKSHVKEEKEISIHHQFLDNGLGLKKSENVKDFKSCKLFIIYSSWTNANDLEKIFLFFVLCHKDDFQNKTSRTFLWERIRKNVTLWLNELHEKDRDQFTLVENSEDTVIYKGNRMSFSQGKINASFFMDKDIGKILQHMCHLVLVSSKLLDSKSSFYQCVLSENTKKKCLYDFMLDEDKEYWFFNPDDFADGFQKRRLNDLRQEYYESNGGKTQNINSSVSNKTACPKAEMEGTKIENPRPFKEEATHILYHENRTLSIPESDGTLSDRCFEFKYFASSLKSDRNFTKFVRETLRFSCGVLNARKNGTIFFGIGDNVQHEDGIKFKHGQIVGFPIKEENEDCKTNYTDVLRLGINKCFSQETCSAALQCIRNPVFVTVLTDDKQEFKFVMEVDVCPLSNFCENLSFRVNLSKYGEPSKACENELVLFLREGSATKKLKGNEELLFLRFDFEKIVKQHKEEEQSNLMNKKLCTESAFYKLQELFCGGLDKFDTDMWPIFVLSKPSDGQKFTKLFFRNLAFLRKIKSIVAVFDFDENSDEDGLSRHISNKDETELYDESIFKEYSGQFDTLKSQLGIPQEEKTIWIFSNGRSGTLNPKPHFQQAEWRLNYRPGITDAISFFNQSYVIPKGRAMFIFLLFTNELDGVIDTFIDAISRFSLEQVIVLAEQKSVYDAFKTSVISEGGLDVDLLDKQSVYGVSWEQISTSLKSFLGEEDKMNCMLATSSGILMPTEERFLESLSDLVVLSATQCENQELGPDKSKKSQEEEFKFYRGNKVSWWNFYFETHVLKRHNFERLKDKVQRVLQSEIQDQRVVITVTLLHEPGAGGSTLANHILWEFRKNYKCCIIRKITERTHIQLLRLWEFKEQNTDQANPLLILIDELTDTEYLYENLVAKIHTEFRKRPCPSKPFCCIILCDTEEQLKEVPKAMTEILSERLYQKLTDKEQNWLETKFKELETTGTNSGIFGFKPEYLLSFMILRSGFNQEYVKKTIKSFLIKIQKFPNEFNLLKYTSLISCYVSSKHNGPKVHIPIDCCDELMGAQLRKYKHGWYEDLSSTVKILLIVEERKHKNGSQIRMAHPLLAKEVFKQIRELVGATIGEITSEFMESSLLKSNTHGRLILEEITKEMLKRRKKLEHGDQLTYFSPLIVDILNEDGQYDKAMELLIKGFDIFNSDHVIAQTIARLYVRNKEFDSAAKWARDAVMLASPNGKPYCIHTLGYVLKEKFVAKTSKLGKVEPSDARKYLNLAIEALDNFLLAQVGNVSFTSSRGLYPFNDTIHIINRITKFLTKNVQVHPDLDWKKYVSDPDYLPQELDNWGNLHGHLKSLQKHGLEAFDTLEEYVCFNTVFNSQSNEEASEQTRRFHSPYRSLQLQYPVMFSTFSDFFGESETIEPTHFPTEDSKNQWHRRKVLHLKGNSFMNIFQIFYDIKKKKLYKTDALDRMTKIHGHLSKITKRSSRDLCNLICVNFALALLDGKRESDETIYEYCKVVIRNNTYGVSLAHFFIMILLWPTSRMKLAYDDEIFQSSLKFLHNDNQQKYKEKQPRVRSSPFKDDEYVICQVTPQFFLTKEEGCKSVCSRLEILFREQQDSFFNNTMWEKKIVKQKLKKLEGQVHFTPGCSNSFILLQNENSDKPIAIRKLRTGRRNILSQVKVTFYLGFSMAGPVAYNIKPVQNGDLSDDEMSASYYNPERDFRAWYEVETDYMEKSLTELQRLVKKIKGIKEKEWTSLSTEEKLLLEEEENITTAIDIKEGRDTMV